MSWQRVFELWEQLKMEDMEAESRESETEGDKK